MRDFLREYGFLVGAATGSLAAYLIGLVVSYLRREKRWLGYAVASRSIVERSHPNLDIIFDGQSIQRLVSHTVIIRNIGNCALKGVPVRVATVDGGSIASHELEQPAGAGYKVSLMGDNALLIECDLLNPREVFQVGLTVIDPASDEVEISARAEKLILKKISATLDASDLIELFVDSLQPGISRLAFRLFTKLFP